MKAIMAPVRRTPENAWLQGKQAVGSGVHALWGSEDSSSFGFTTREVLPQRERRPGGLGRSADRAKTLLPGFHHQHDDPTHQAPLETTALQEKRHMVPRLRPRPARPGFTGAKVAR
jgi:hypothetical protein